MYGEELIGNNRSETRINNHYPAQNSKKCAENCIYLPEYLFKRINMLSFATEKLQIKQLIN